MAELKVGNPPPAPRVPARKSLLLVVLGMLAAVVGIAFGAKALLSSKDAAALGKTAASLAGGGVVVASMGAPALKRQALAREQLAAFAARRGLAAAGPDEVGGAIDGVSIAVRVVYGSGPYKARGASGILVHVRPAGADPIFFTDAEPFDDAAIVAKHLDRLTDRAIRKVSPAA
jgi:hypothetical protein